MADGVGREAEERRKLARETYLEVLDATKHHDDKIGRFITGISFLTAGAIGFGLRNDVLVIRYSMGPSEVPLPAIFFTSFLLLVLLGVLLLIVSLGPNIELPTGPKTSSLQGSRLFFLFIAGETSSGWRRRWSTDVSLDQLTQDVTDDYVREARNIATKTDFKHLRTGEARAVLSLAILALAVGLVLAVNGWAGVEVGSSSSNLNLTGLDSVAWSLRPKLLSASVIAVFVLVLGYDIYRLEQSLETRLARKKERGLQRLLGAIVVLTALPFLVLLSPSGEFHPFRIVALVGPPLVALLLHDRYLSAPAKTVLWMLVGGLFLALLVTCVEELPEWQVAVACGVAMIVGVPRLLSGFETWHRRKGEADKMLAAVRQHLREVRGSGTAPNTDPLNELRGVQARRTAGRTDEPRPDLAVAIAEFARLNNIDRESWEEVGVSRSILDAAGIRAGADPASDRPDDPRTGEDGS